MIYNDDTSARIVVGYLLGFDEYSLPLDVVEEMAEIFDELNDEYDLGLSFFVPGDTSDTGIGKASSAVIAKSVVFSECWGGPESFDPAKISDALEGLKPIPPEFWTRFHDAAPNLKPTDAPQPEAYLLSFGPLCYGAIFIGQAMTQDESDDAVYEFVANQDMEQGWTHDGLDGVHLQSVEFDDVSKVNISEEDKEKVPAFENPSYFLVCRYD